MLPSTYREYSRQVLGYYEPNPTPAIAEYIATVTLQRISLRAITPERTFLKWNGGEGREACSKGYNKNGNWFNSCEYMEKAMEYYRQITGN